LSEALNKVDLWILSTSMPRGGNILYCVGKRGAAQARMFFGG